MDTLKPVEVSKYYIDRVASGMSRYFWDNIFKGIFDILKNNSVENSKDNVINALKSGRIWYENGAFRTKTRFSSKVSATLEAMGARFQYNAYYIAESLIPFEYVQVIAFVNAQNLAKANRILEHLGGLAAVLAGISLDKYIEIAVELMFKKLQLDIVKSAQEAKIPVIELGIVQPKVKLPKEKTKPLEQYWKEQDKKANELRKAIKEFIDYYNNNRYQERFNNLAPMEVRTAALATETPIQYPIPENKRILAYKAELEAKKKRAS